MAKKPKEPARIFDALRDTIDFRDTLYVPTLIAVSAISDLSTYRGYGIPVLDQGREGACTGFGLATVANYLLKARGKNPNADPVSARMLYVMAKRYDEWPGEDYEGSSARGAMKGWHKHGLCAAALWKDDDHDTTLTAERAADAIARPLGAYFRVNHKDLVAMHAAITEAGILFATALVHEGWQQVAPGADRIAFQPGNIGGHAFAIVGYDRDGFWIQNSWGPNWGAGGLALLTYADWLSNGSDVWVSALGAPVRFEQPIGSASMMAGAPRSYESRTYADLRPHIVTAKNDGILDDKGTYGLTEAGLKDIVTKRLPDRVSKWDRKRVVLYAHGGLVAEETAVQAVANNLEALMAADVYPISFIWRSDAITTIKNILKEAIFGRRQEGVLDGAKDFLLDRLDDTLEPLARILGGKALWDEMKKNAEGATKKAKGAARLTAGHLAGIYGQSIDEIHLVGHSAGAILHAFLADELIRLGVTIESLSLWAPACTIEAFQTHYRPHVESGQIKAFDLYILDDATEQDDDCAGIYHKSLLYLVSAAFEAVPRIIGNGTPLLGLERDARNVQLIPAAFWERANVHLYVAPGRESKALHHGDFDNDTTTLLNTLHRITGSVPTAGVTQSATMVRARSQIEKRSFRRKLDAVLAH